MRGWETLLTTHIGDRAELERSVVLTPPWMWASKGTAEVGINRESSPRSVDHEIALN